MAFSAVPFALQNVPINADVVREAVSSLLPNTGGLVQAGDLAVTQTSVASMAVQIGVGRAWIPGNNIANVSGQAYSKQGQYYVLNDAALTVSIATANSTNPRIDTIYVAIQDATYSGTANGIDPVNVVTGAPSSTPVATAAPSNSITLATVYVAANAASITSSNITNLAVPYNLQHAEFTGPAFTTTANTPTNIGTLTADTGTTFNNTFCTGGSGGVVTFTKAGIYSIDLLMFPGSAPGASTAFLTTAGNIMAVGSGGAVGRVEFGCSAAGIYFASGAGFIAQCFTTNSVLIGSRIRITRTQGA